MKKNGKRYRKIKKEKEAKRSNDLSEIKKDIEQEVDGINTAYLSMAHIVSKNPVCNDCVSVKQEYLKRLKSYIKAGGLHRRKFESAELQAYEKIIIETSEVIEEHDLEFYRYYILFDVLHILGYDIKGISKEKFQSVIERYYDDYPKMIENMDIVTEILKSIKGSGKKLKQLEENPMLVQEKEYIQLIRKNIMFKEWKPFGIMVTATMSAGKSTFINALTGKYICLSQNMACTSKIHFIVNKAFEDGYSYEYDHDLVMTAGREELLNDNELNSSDKIVVSTNFNGGLSRHRVIVSDSPGVNYSGDKEHKIITDRLIKGRNYNLLIYLMNATQLATNDEDEHLDYVKKTIGRTPVLFVINKIDSFNVEEENVEAAIKRQIAYLKGKGFKNPIVCPVSSKAGYLAKVFKAGNLSRSEERELYNYVDKFEQMKLIEYYSKNYKCVKVPDKDMEEAQLLKTCGLAYVEKIIEILLTGGKINGADIH